MTKNFVLNLLEKSPDSHGTNHFVMKFCATCIALFFFSYSKIFSQCPPLGCTWTVSTSTSSPSYTVNPGEKLCITGTGFYSGSITINAGGTVENCGTISGSINFSGGSLINRNVIMPNLNINSGCVYTNYATSSAGITIQGGTVNNFGTLNPSFFSFNAGTLHNQTGATMNLPGLSLNNGSVLMNDGTINSSSTFNVSNGATVTNNNVINAPNGGSNDGSITNNGRMIFSSGGFSVNSNGSLTNNCYVSVGGNFDNNKTLINSGTIEVNTGTFTNQSGGTLTLVSNSLINSWDFNNGRTISGPISAPYARINVNGKSNNQSSSSITDMWMYAMP